MDNIETKEDLLCSFFAYLRSHMNMLAFKPVELADMRSRFMDLQVRCNYEGNKVIFNVEGYDSGILSNSIETMALIKTLKNNPVMLEQDWVLLFCMVILREPDGKLVISRNEIENARRHKKIKLKLTYFKAEDQFVLKYEKQSLILSGAN